MDFGALDLRKAADKEYWIHLRRGDQLLYADDEVCEKPCRAKVASISKPGVDDAIKAVTRAGRMLGAGEAQLIQANRQQRAELEKRLAGIETEAEAAIKRFLMTAVLDWENLQVDGKDVPFSRDMLDDWSDKGGPLHVLGLDIAEDVAAAMSPFGKAGSAS
jgi:hypothetical protein